MSQHQALKQIDELRERTTELDYQVNIKAHKIFSHENSLQELQERMTTAEA
jgi:hypothetical protein